MNPLLFLKEGTRALHDRVERRIDLRSCLQSKDQYVLLLHTLYGFYERSECALDAALRSIVCPFAFLRKSPLIANDLSILGSGQPAVECHRVPQIDSLEEAFGVLYVLEGSTLGGQFISRQVQRELGFSPQAGCSFFWGYGEQTATNWRTFCEVVARHATTARSRQRMLLTARETFRCLDHCLELRGYGV
ncbi:MAG: biliverdin-producing heme oxygenase [Bdellovibrionota bacterium]